MGKETYYKKKRKKAGLAPSDMAKELGINYKKYNLIENGVVKMPKNLIDKFNEIVSKGKNEHALERLNHEAEVNVFWNDVTTKVDGKYTLKDKMKEFNIKTFKELANLLGVSGSNLSHYLSGDCDAPYDFKNTMYLFFQDELNIQVPKKNNVKGTGKQGSNKQCNDPVLLEWFDETDLKALVAKHNLKYEQIAKDTGMHVSCVSRNIRKDRNMVPSTKTLVALKKYFDSLEETSTNYLQVGPVAEPECKTTVASTNFEDFVVDEIDQKPTDKFDISFKYIKELTENEELIAFYTDKIRELELRNKVCKEVLHVINEIRGE